MAATSAPAPEPPATLVAQGVLRIDGASTSCKDVIGVTSDGGAAVMCTFEREDGCAIRRFGPDGEELSRSDLAPGICAAWTAREGGGGFLVTRATDYRSITITALDANGKRTASNALTSHEEVYPFDASLAADGGVFVSLQFRRDLMFGKRRLGTTKFSTSGIVKLPPALDRVAWSRLFDTRRTYIAALLPATHAGVDALISTRGPLVAGTPVNPPINPNDGSIYGGDSYGWKAERVALDQRGKPVARVDMTVEPRRSVDYAAPVGDAVATLTSNPKDSDLTNLTLVRADGQRERTTLGAVSQGFHDDSGRIWVIECDCRYDNVAGKLTGTWKAREIGGAQMSIVLAGAFGSSVTWVSLAVTGDRIAAIGTTDDPATGTPLTFVALAKLSRTASSVDLAKLGVVDHLALAPACRGPRAGLTTLVSGRAFDPALEACGVAPKARIEMTTYRDGGLRTFDITGASREVVACARRVFEPVVACPVIGSNVSFWVRLP